MNDDCLRFCLVCKDIGQIFIDEEETHRICNLHKHSEIRNLSIKCRMCDSIAYSIKANDLKASPLSKEVKSDFCDQLCLKCDRLGGFYVNFSKYHALCDLHIHEGILNNILVDCNHCHSNVLFIYDVISRPSMKKTIILFKFRNYDSMTLKLSSPNNVKSVKLSNNMKNDSSAKKLNSNTGSSVSNTVNIIQLPYSKNRPLSESTGLSKITDLNSLINKSEISNFNKAMKIPSPGQNNRLLSESQKHEKPLKKIEINIIPSKPIDDCDIDTSPLEETKINSIYKTIQIFSNDKDFKKEFSIPTPDPVEKEFCHMHRDLPAVKREYYFHFNLRSVSPSPLPIRSNNILTINDKDDINPSKKLAPNTSCIKIPVRSERNICINCYDFAKIAVYGAKMLCKNCKESKNSDAMNFLCSHNGCELCYFEGTCCFKCWVKEHISEDKGCFKCLKKRDSVRLFCGHFICKKCRKQKKIKRFNYSCIECCFNKVKRCLSCNKISEWEIIEENSLLHKKCCDNYYCLYCFDKKIKFFGHYRDCTCLKDKSIFKRIKEIKETK